jgi:hypothetical protein
MAIRKDIGTALDQLSRNSGIDRGVLRERFHRIKRHGRTPQPNDINFIDDMNGDVYDAPAGQVGEYIGNVFDDF